MKMAHLGHAVPEHVYAVRKGPADLLISQQAFDHHLGEIRDHLQGKHVRPKSFISCVRHNTHLLSRCLALQTGRELRKIAVHACHDGGDGRRALGAARPRVSHVHADQHRLLLCQPLQVPVVQLVIDASQLRVHLERDVGKVLILLLGIRKHLVGEHVHGVDPQLDVTDTFDAGIDVVVALGQDDEHKRRRSPSLLVLPDQ